MLDAMRGVRPASPWLLAWLSLAAAAAALAQEPRDRVPAEPMSFRGAQWLEREEREREEQPDTVLDALRLQPGDVVADIGSGSGYFARRMARRVLPGGTVYCQDIQSEMLEIMKQIADAERVTGITPLLGTPADPKLPAGEIDWILLADVYHEMSAPGPMLARMREALAPGGKVALLEYRAEDGTGDHIRADHTMSVRQVLAEWKAGGFELVDLLEFMPAQHLFVLRARPAGRVSPDALQDYDLLDAVERGLIETEAVGSGAERVTVRIRRTAARRLVITAPAGLYFRSDGQARDMIARRDAAVVLSRDGWHEWTVRAVGLQRDRRPASARDVRDPAARKRAGAAPAHAGRAGRHVHGVRLTGAVCAAGPRGRAGRRLDRSGESRLRRARADRWHRAHTRAVRRRLRPGVLRSGRHRRRDQTCLGTARADFRCAPRSGAAGLVPAQERPRAGASLDSS